MITKWLLTILGMLYKVVSGLFILTLIYFCVINDFLLMIYKVVLSKFITIKINYQCLKKGY